MAKSTTTRQIGELPTDPTPNLTTGMNQKNHLLVITINDYVHCPKLFNTVKDGDDFVSLLTAKYQFEPANVVRISNEKATDGNILAQFRNYAKRLTESDNLIILFSGHGTFDAVFDEGYWIPVDARFENGQPEISDCIANSQIVTAISAMKAKHVVLIADACFSGSLASQKLVGVERLEEFKSRWLLTAGRNEPVLDGSMGENSPFMEAILDFLDKKSTASNGFVRVSELGQHVTTVVARNESQIPICVPMQNVGDQNGEFLFRIRRDEQRDWLLFQKMNTLEGYRTYLSLYPNGRFSVDSLQAIHHLETPVEQGAKVRQGSVLYNIPNHMLLDVETRCVVRVAFDEILIREGINVDSETVVKTIRVSEVMTAELLDTSGKSAFSIRSINSKEQFVDKDLATEWIFMVKSLLKGEHVLTLKIGVIETINGKERLREIVLDEKILVVEEIKFSTPTPEMELKKLDTPLVLFPNSGGFATTSAPPPSGEFPSDLPSSSPPPEFSSGDMDAPPPIPTPRSSWRSMAIGGGLSAILLLMMVPFLMDNGGLDAGKKPNSETPIVVNDPEIAPNTPTKGSSDKPPTDAGVQVDKPSNATSTPKPPAPVVRPTPAPAPPPPKPKPKPKPVPPKNQQTTVRKSGNKENYNRSVERLEMPIDVWEKVKISEDIPFLESMLKEYPKSKHTEDIKNKIGVLKKEALLRNIEELKRIEAEKLNKNQNE